MRRSISLALVSLAFVLMVSGLIIPGKIDAAGKDAVLKGGIYRRDKMHPVAGAKILLLDEKKTQNSDKSVDTNADENGAYRFDHVADGVYTVSIRTWYERQEDVPCKLLMGRTKDKNSNVIVMRDQAKYVEQIFVRGFSVKGGKEIERDFDLECSSMFDSK